MNTFMTSAGNCFEWVLQNSWKAAVLAVVVLIVQLTLRKKLSPAWRYGLWLLVVARLIVPTSPQSVISIFNLSKFAPPQRATTMVAPVQSVAKSVLTPDTQLPASSPAIRISDSMPARVERPVESQPSFVPATGTVSAVHDESKRPLDWFVIACGIWLAGACLLGLRLVWVNVQFRSRLARCVPVSDVRIKQLVRDSAEILGVKQRMTVIETEEVESPAVCGLWNKELLLPMGAFERFSPDELRHIFLHELAHIKRRDLEVNWLVAILQIIHWFNPMVWLAFAQMGAERELAADALALAHIRDPESVLYGKTILKVLENLAGKSAQPGLVGIAESKARMKERLLAIIHHGTVKSWRWAAVGIAVVLAGIGLTGAQQMREPSDKVAPGSNQQQFAIRVLDHEDGTPLSGVAVNFTLDYFGGNSKKQDQLTDKNGRATIQYSATDLKHLAYQAQKTNYLSLHGEWFNQELNPLGAEFQIKLSQGLEIGGTVTDENGKPLAGAEISIDQPINMLLTEGSRGAYHAEMWSAPGGQLLATTDTAGRWKAKCIWPTVQWASLRVHHPDFADATFSTELTSAMEAEGKGNKVNFDDLLKRDAHMALAKGIAVNGSVVNEAGGPLAGLEVSWAELVISPHSRDQLLGLRKVTTDKSGKFHLGHAPPKHLYFLVQTPGYAPTVAELDPKQPESEIELRLAKGRNFVGEIKDNQGDDIVDAHLSFADFSIWRGVHWEAVTDSRGRFDWNDAPAEKFQLQIEKDGYITQQKIVQAVDDSPVNIRLNRTLNITGNVVDAETKKPLKEFRIDWLDRSDPKDFDAGYKFTTIPGSNGVFSLDVGRLYSDTWFGGYAHDCVIRIEADGYATVISRVFNSRKGDVGNVSYDVEIKPAQQIFGTVIDGDGHPVGAVQVALKIPGSKLLLSGKPFFSGSTSSGFKLTDAQGRFHLNANPASRGLVAVHEKGFAEVGTNELSTDLIVKLQPWGRIEGKVWEYNKPVTNQEVWASAASASWPESLRTEFRTNSDDQGRFAFEFVPPGKYSICRMIPMGHGGSSGPREMVRVEPGATSSLKVGGQGRPVIGQLKIMNPYVAIDWQHDYYTAHSIRPQPPKELKTAAEFEAWRNQPEIQQAYDAARSYPMKFAADGSFRIEEMLPGKYEMQINIYDPRDPEAFAYSKYIASTTKTFEVPESNASEPLDIETFEITLKPDAKLGATDAPGFEATDMEGKPFKLSDFHGKYVLLDFWATWCGPCIGEFPYLKQLHEKYKDRNDFLIIALSVDKTINEPRDFLKKNDLPWMQLYLGNWADSKVPAEYGVQGIPSVFLINPDGKIIDSDMEGSSMVMRLGKYLK